MGYGIPFTEIYNRFFDSRSFSELKLMGRALSNAELLFGGDVVCSQITAAEIASWLAAVRIWSHHQLSEGRIGRKGGLLLLRKDGNGCKGQFPRQ